MLTKSREKHRACCVLAIALGIFLSMVPPLLRAQSIEPSITVNGKPVFTERPVLRFEGDWFLPLAPIVRALNGQLTFSPQRDSFTVRKNDGVEITYDVRTGELRQRAVVIGRVTAYQRVQL